MQFSTLLLLFPESILSNTKIIMTRIVVMYILLNIP